MLVDSNSKLTTKSLTDNLSERSIAETLTYFAIEAECNPITPTIIIVRDNIFTVETGSLKYSMPMAAVRAVPTPDQIAYATDSSMVLTATVLSENAQA